MERENPFTGQLPGNYSLKNDQFFVFNPTSKKSAKGLITEAEGVFRIDFFQSSYNDDYLRRMLRRDFGLERGALEVTFSNLPQAGDEITLNYDSQHTNPGSKNLLKGTSYYSVNSHRIDCNPGYLHKDFQATFVDRIYGRCDGVGDNQPYSVFRLS